MATEKTLLKLNNFDAARVFTSGQCFRWHREGEGWAGVAAGRFLRLLPHDGGWIADGCDEAAFRSFWAGYFDLGRDYDAIAEALCRGDDVMKRAVALNPGMRIVRQQPFEALITFILSQNNNIPRITSLVERLCLLFGSPFYGGGETRYAFPTARTLASADRQALAPLRAGYRERYILDAARRVAEGSIDLDALASDKVGLDEARQTLMGITGVGEKVADCVLLYGLGRMDAFPKDVWVRRAMARLYGSSFDPARFAPWQGIAQQYLFCMMRETPVMPAESV